MRSPIVVQTFLFASVALASQRACATEDEVIINEIHYHPLSDCQEEEFIELYNRGDSAADLGGWTFLEGIPFTFPPGTELGSHEYLVVARDPGSLQARIGPIARIHGPWAAWPGGARQASLADDGEDLVLANSAGTVMNRVKYNDKSPWPVLPDGGGPSLELVSPDLPNTDPGNWRAASATALSQWTQYKTIGKAFNTELVLRLTEEGSWYIDDVELRAEGGGENLVRNGGFESEGEWAFEGNHSGSARVTSVAHSGQACLKVFSSGQGDAANAVRQIISGVSLAGPSYSLSFWARRAQGGSRLVAALPGGDASFAAAESIPAGFKLGNYTFDPASGTYAVTGAGLGPSLPEDSLYFVHSSLQGDGLLEAKVTWTHAVDDRAKAGLMIRETMTADSPCAMVVLSRGAGVWMQYRLAPGSPLVTVQGPPTPGPVKLRIERQGTTIAATADTGAGPEEIQRVEIPMVASALIGLLVDSNDKSFPATAAFEGVVRDSPPLELSTPAGAAPATAASPGAPNTAFAHRTPPSIRKVQHAPLSPRSSNDVVVQAKVDCLDATPVTSVRVEYQVVPPGHYIRISDGDYARDWIPAALRDDGSSGDEAAGDSIWAATIPAQPNRTLIRYRILATDASGGSTQLPFPEDPTPNFAYFVHDGVPDYVADRKSFQGMVPHHHSASGLSALPIYQLLTDAADFQACLDDSDAGLDPNLYRWRGTLVSGSEVYDHIRFRLRGQSTRALAKKSFKIKFNHGSRFERTDNLGSPDPVKRSRLNLNAAFQNSAGGGDKGEKSISPRGECGLYDTLAFYLFRSLGVPSPETSWVQLRVIRSESPDGIDQYEGDFFGIYLDVEEPDSRFLKAHSLADGNLYKIEDGWTKEANSCDPADDSDIRTFVETLPIQHSPRDPPLNIDAGWLSDHVDLQEYFSYYAAIQMAAQQDIGSHNTYFFNPAENHRWMRLPWDMNLTFTWGAPGSVGLKDDGWVDPIIDSHPLFSIAFKNRLREGMDLLYLEEKLFPIIDGWASLIAPVVAADRDRWDDGSLDTPYGPLTERVADLKSWIRAHRLALAALGADDTIPATPEILSPPPNSRLPVESLDFAASVFSGFAGRAHSATQWIATRVSKSTGAPPALTSLLAENELAPRWDSGPVTADKTSVRVPSDGIDPDAGASYRVRVRYLDDAGRWSHWSPPLDVEIAPASAARFVRGNANGDGRTDITDAVSILSYLFLGHGDLDCRKAGDANDDGTVNLSDAIFVLAHLFIGGAQPPTPFPECGEDPTADALPCVTPPCQ